MLLITGSLVIIVIIKGVNSSCFSIPTDPLLFYMLLIILGIIYLFNV